MASSSPEACLVCAAPPLSAAAFGRGLCRAFWTGSCGSACACTSRRATGGSRDRGGLPPPTSRTGRRGPKPSQRSVLASLSLHGTQEAGRGWGRGSGSRDGGGRGRLPRTPVQDHGCPACSRPRAHRSGASGVLQGRALGAHRRAHRRERLAPATALRLGSVPPSVGPRGAARRLALTEAVGPLQAVTALTCRASGSGGPRRRQRCGTHTSFRDVHGLPAAVSGAPQRSSSH